MRNAIDRIKGYCTEVNQAQWEELVRAADEVGVGVWRGPINYKRAAYGEEMIQTWGEKADEANGELIPFPDFIAKLRGEWKPKAGEMVEVEINGKWKSVKFVGDNDAAIVWFDPFGQTKYRESTSCRPIRPTITRAEAEQQLGKRIID